MKRLLLTLLVALALPTAVNGERKNGWEHIFTNNNDEMLYIKILDPKSNKRYRSFETKLYTNEEVIQKTRKIDCKENIHAIHINHSVSPDSDKWEEFCKILTIF